MRIKHSIVGAAVLGLAGVSGPALAADAATYDYIEARYAVFGELSGPGNDADITGLGLEGSRTFDEMFFVRITSDMYTLDVNGAADAGLDLFSIGPGIRLPLDAPGTLSLWGQVNYERIVLGGPVGTGFGLTGGVRFQITPDIDAGVTLRTAATDGDSADIDYTTLEVEGAWSVNDRIDLTASMVNGTIEPNPGPDRDLETVLRAGVRMPF